MKKLISMILIVLLIGPVLARENRETKQARLDDACEVARQEKLTPLREELVNKCIDTNEQPSRKECEKEYANHGAHVGAQQPLFYDLPECVAALEFQQGVRKPNL
jgi:hypothetical protein